MPLRRSPLLLSIIFGLVSAAFARADSGDDNLRLLREQQQQLEQLRRQEQPRPGGAPLTPSPTLTPAVALPALTCLPVTQLAWQGAAPLYSADRRTLDRRYSNRCLDEDALTQLLQEANLILLRQGHVTSRALLRENAFQSGVLTLTLITGRIAAIRADGLGPREIRTTLPDVQDGAFNLRDLEQGLDQLNRLASNLVVAELRPGARLGDSELWLSNQRRRPWRIFAGLDNGGSPATGDVVANIGMAADNLLDSGDFWNLAFRRSLPDTPDAKAQGTSLYLSQPWGYWTASASLAMAESEVPLTLPTLTLLSRTRTFTPTLRVERVLARNAQRLWTAQLTLSRRETESTLDGERLDISSPTHSSAELGLQYDSVSPWPWGARLSRTQGLSWFGADRDSAATVGLPRAQFEKWRLELHTSYASGRWHYLAETVAQYSPHRLPGAEELVVGDGNSVRGFHTDPVSARRGWYLRQTLTHALNTFLQPYVGLDGGHAPTLGGSDWLGSLSLGLRANARGHGLDVSFSRAWRQEVAPPAPRLMARYSVSF